MLPIHKIIWAEWRAKERPVRVPEPSEAMEDPEQIRAYVKAYEWGGPTSALQLHHLTQLASMIRPGDIVLDLACGPGPLLLELAAIYPDCKFIGVDLSKPMLDALTEQCLARGIVNVEARCEDICELSSVAAGSIDVVISTSALHHLPRVGLLEDAFRRISAVLKVGGGVYIFDFGLLRSSRARKILVNDVRARAPKVTAIDYDNSLNAAFMVDEISVIVKKYIPFAKITSSAFIDFLVFIQSAPRCSAKNSIMEHISEIKYRMSVSIRIELLMLKYLQKSRN